jgi:hypothetical protein
MKRIADGVPWTMPATIDDPAILDEIADALQEKRVVTAARGTRITDVHSVDPSGAPN